MKLYQIKNQYNRIKSDYSNLERGKKKGELATYRDKESERTYTLHLPDCKINYTPK